VLPSRILPALLCAGALLTGVLSAGAPAQARPAPRGQDPIMAGQPYTGDFPDPWIMRLGAKYYAYSTTSDRVNVPMLTSTNLRTWIARPPTLPSNPRGDALVTPAAWSGSQGPWAPSVTRVARHHFVLAYAVQVAAAPGTRMCISLAHARTPYGPFVDSTSAPTVCLARGAIDPQVFMAPSGRPWLLWRKDHFPAKLVTQPMNRKATKVRPGVKPRLLAKISQPWEGSIIENPAMIRYKKRYYVFYSANSYATTRYATSYLICKSFKGDCHKPRKTPLLRTAGGIAGPGGPAPFVDTRGRLRLGYHAWTVGKVGYPTSAECRDEPGGCGQRRLYVASLRVGDGGRLHVVRRY
jgi:beta-xylosidase